jgi:hypothetical protein
MAAKSNVDPSSCGFDYSQRSLHAKQYRFPLHRSSTVHWMTEDHLKQRGSLGRRRKSSRSLTRTEVKVLKRRRRNSPEAPRLTRGQGGFAPPLSIFVSDLFHRLTLHSIIIPLLYIKPLPPCNCRYVPIESITQCALSLQQTSRLKSAQINKMFQRDYKMPQLHQLHQRTSYDSKASYDSASLSESEDEKDLPPPYGLVFCNRISQNRPLTPLPSQGHRRVRFEVEKPLPPL